jgi:hypothetical protein
MLPEGFLKAPGAEGGSDALIDRHRLLRWRASRLTGSLIAGPVIGAVSARG